MFKSFSDRARKVMALANQEALRLNHDYIGTEHILLGLLREGSGIGANILTNLGIDFRRLRADVVRLAPEGPEEIPTRRLDPTPRARKIVEYAIEEARNHPHNHVCTEHLLLGLIREERGVAAQVLIALNLSHEALRTEAVRVRTSAEAAGRELEQLGVVETDARQLEFGRVFGSAYDEATNVGDKTVGPRHLLLAMLRSPDSVVREILRRLNLTPEQARTMIMSIRDDADPPSR